MTQLILIGVTLPGPKLAPCGLRCPSFASIGAHLVILDCQIHQHACGGTIHHRGGKPTITWGPGVGF